MEARLPRRLRRWRRARRAGKPAPFVVGAARSGTTLLRLMLDAHSELAIPAETGFVPQLIDVSRQPGATPERVAAAFIEHRRFGDFGFEPAEIREMFGAVEPFNVADAVRAFYVAYAERQGKSRWGDKTPGYALRMRLLARVFPEAHFIHIIRDGRDVRLSQLRNSENPPSAAKHGKRWRRRVRIGRRQGGKVPHYLELRFEDLITDAEAELRRICEFIELDWDPAMLRYHERAADRLDEMRRDMKPGDEVAEGRARRFWGGDERVFQHELTSEPPRPDRIAKWKREMPPEDVAEFDRVAGALLAELGYEVGGKVGHVESRG